MEDIVNYIGINYPTILRLTIEHLYLVSISVGAAILIGVPIGILITKDKKLADTVLYVASVIITIPSVAMFGLMIPFVAGQPRYRILAGSHRHIPLLTTADHPKHVHRHSQYRSCTP